MIIPLHHAPLQTPCWSSLTSPNPAPWTSPCRIEHHCKSPSWNAPPWPWGTWPPSEITWASCDDCATMHHLVGRLLSWQTWDLRAPTLIPFILFLSYCVLMLLSLLHSCLLHLYAHS